MSKSIRLANAPEEEWSYSNIKVLRLRHDVIAQEVLRLKTIEIDHEPSQDKATTEETAKSENLVNHVPDVMSCERPKFDFGNRTFVYAIAKGSATESPGRFLMYKCNEPRAGSPLENMEMNPFFKDIKGARAFGDVFIFKTFEGYPPDKNGRVRYADEWEIKEKDLSRLLKTMARL